MTQPEASPDEIEALIERLEQIAAERDRDHDSYDAEITLDIRQAATALRSERERNKALVEVLTEYVRDFGDNEDADSKRMTAKAVTALRTARALVKEPSK